MQSGVHRTLYDGPVSAGQLRKLKPHAGCFGKGCCKTALHEGEGEEWHIVRGKPYCDQCFRDRGARMAAREAKAAEREAAASAACGQLRRRPDGGSR